MFPLVLLNVVISPALLLQQLRMLSPVIEVSPFVFIADYFSHIGKLNQLLVLSQQLEDDVQHLGSHKYIAHQLSVLYVSIILICLWAYCNNWPSAYYISCHVLSCIRIILLLFPPFFPASFLNEIIVTIWIPLKRTLFMQNNMWFWLKV